jgi:hypothetical protein
VAVVAYVSEVCATLHLSRDAPWPLGAWTFLRISFSDRNVDCSPTQEDSRGMRGNNGSIRQNLMANAESREFRELQRAIAKAHGDRARAIKAVCRFYTVSDFDRLPAPIKSAALSLLPD